MNELGQGYVGTPTIFIFMYFEPVHICAVYMYDML